jgi:hypothetical protein
MSKISVKVDKTKIKQILSIIKAFQSKDVFKIAAALGIDPSDVVDIYTQIKED